MTPTIYNHPVTLGLDAKERSVLSTSLLRSAVLLDRKVSSLKNLGRGTHAGTVVDEAYVLRIVAATLGRDDVVELSYHDARIVRRALSVTVDKIETGIEKKLEAENILDKAQVDKLDMLEDILDNIVGQMLDQRQTQKESS